MLFQKLKLLKKNKLFSALFFSQFFLYLFVAFVPLQISTLLYTRELFVGGFFNPFQSQFLYLADIFLIVAIFFGALYLASGKKLKLDLKFGDSKLFSLIVTFVFVQLVVVILANDKLNSLLYFLRSLEFLFFYVVVVSKFLDFRRIVLILTGVVSLSAVVGILQFFMQGSVGLSFLGEVLVSSEMKGVAKISFDNVTLLRAYGLFAHPNIFGGYLVFTIFLFSTFCSRKKKYFYPILGLLLLALGLTFSRSALLAFFTALPLFVLLMSKKLSLKTLILILLAMFLLIFIIDIGLIAFVNNIDSLSLSERVLFQEISLEMFLNHPFGVGFGNFTALMQDFANLKLAPWQLQPVHNIFLLTMNELGVQGLMVLMVLLSYGLSLLFESYRKERKVKRRIVAAVAGILIFVLFTIGLFDHYFISIYQGQFLFWLTLIFLARVEDKTFVAV